MEAMAVGVPVILPPEFAPTFGAGRALCRARGGLAAGRAALARPRVLGGARRRGPRLRAAHLRLRRLPRAARPARRGARPGRGPLRPPMRPNGQPLFSVIVPVYRQWELVPALLDALAAQTLAAGRFEVLVVNNEAPAPPPPLALPANARLRRAPEPGSYAARNAGAAAAGGAWLVFTDADCRPDPGWLAALAAAAAAATPGPRLLAGPVRVEAPPPAPTPSRSTTWCAASPRRAYVARGYAATANLAVPAAVFRALGGFDAGRFSGGDARLLPPRRRGRPPGPPGARGARSPIPAAPSWDELATQGAAHQGRPGRGGPPAPPRSPGPCARWPAAARQPRLSCAPPPAAPPPDRGRACASASGGWSSPRPRGSRRRRAGAALSLSGRRLISA